MSKDALKRIVNKDIKEIKKMELDKMGIHIHFNEDNMMKASAIIIGPKGTPYENGILYFLIEFPVNYPFSPPRVGYLSKSRYRIHPNLYVGRSHDSYIGKVCLSTINTWSGPKWTTVMHIGSVLLSIQSLLNENPLHNEPGFEEEKGERNDLYNIVVEHDNYSHLILNNGFKIHPLITPLEPIIKEHLKKEKDNIIKRLDILSKKHPKPAKVTPNIYNISMPIYYPSLKGELSCRLEEL